MQISTKLNYVRSTVIFFFLKTKKQDKVAVAAPLDNNNRATFYVGLFRRLQRPLSHGSLYMFGDAAELTN